MYLDHSVYVHSKHHNYLDPAIDNYKVSYDKLAPGYEHLHPEVNLSQKRRDEWEYPVTTPSRSLGQGIAPVGSFS